MIFALWIRGSQKKHFENGRNKFQGYRRPRDHPTSWINPSPIPVGLSQTSNDKLNLRTLVFLSLYKKVVLCRYYDGTNN
jgi:hypothetical protein